MTVPTADTWAHRALYPDDDFGPAADAAARDRALRGEWRAWARRVLGADAYARCSWWAARPRRELLEEAARLSAPGTPCEEIFAEWSARSLAALVTDGQTAFVLDTISAGWPLAEAAEEIKRLTQRP